MASLLLSLNLQSQCINSWVCANKLEPEFGFKLVHAAWLDHKPMVCVPLCIVVYAMLEC